MIKLLEYNTNFSRFFRRKGPLPIPNTIFLIVDGVMIECNGPLLAQHSQILFDKLTKHNEIYLDEFTGMIEGVLDCVELLYGADVEVTLDNLQALMKFSILYKVPSMYELCVKWVQDNVSLEKFEKFFMVSYFVSELEKGHCHALDACRDVILRDKPTERVQILKNVTFKDDQKDLMMFFLDPTLWKFTLPLITDWMDTNEKVDMVLRKIGSDPAKYIFTDTASVGLDFTSKIAATATAKETVIKVNKYVTDVLRQKDKTMNKTSEIRNLELFLWRKSWNELTGQLLINHLNSSNLKPTAIIEICLSIQDAGVSIGLLWPTVDPNIVGRKYYDLILGMVPHHLRPNMHGHDKLFGMMKLMPAGQPQGYYQVINQGQCNQLINKQPVTLLFHCQVQGCTQTTPHAVTLQLSYTKPCFDLSVTSRKDPAGQGHVHEGSVVHWYFYNASTNSLVSMVTMSFTELILFFKSYTNIQRLNIGCILTS